MWQTSTFGGGAAKVEVETIPASKVKAKNFIFIDTLPNSSNGYFSYLRVFPSTRNDLNYLAIQRARPVAAISAYYRLETWICMVVRSERKQNEICLAKFHTNPLLHLHTRTRFPVLQSVSDCKSILYWVLTTARLSEYSPGILFKVSPSTRKDPCCIPWSNEFLGWPPIGQVFLSVQGLLLDGCNSHIDCGKSTGSTRLPVRQSLLLLAPYFDPPICKAFDRLGSFHRSWSNSLWHTFNTTH